MPRFTVRDWRLTNILLVLTLGGAPAPLFGQGPGTEVGIQDPGAVVDAAYIRWLEERSILHQAFLQSQKVSGQGLQWQHPYGDPQPREVVKKASVWLLDWPGAVIPAPGKSVMATWADPQLWDAFQDIGIQLLHIGPVNRAGGIVRRQYTPSTDGWFDPIALEIDPQLGTEAEYRQMVRTAAQRQGLIAGDLVPLHTGTGADFRLAQMGYRDYPGMYTMVEIRKQDWSLLPEVRDLWTSVPVPKDTADLLTRKGYLPGRINNNDAVKNARDLSGWAATGQVAGADGRPRRWVFLHYFKPGQPALNWLDPSCAGPRAVFGDLTRTIHDLGARVIRLDAVPFLGIEAEPGKPLSRHFKHPLSVVGTNQLAMLTRKFGGWSFHELNLPLTELKKFTNHGPDLSYDFFTRAQCLHAVLLGDATLLRQAYGFLLEAEVDPVSLVHDLQNHDEITYQLVELDHRKDETFEIRGQKVTGKQLRERMLEEMRARATGDAAPHNKLYRPEKDGIATTFAGFVAAALGIRDPYHASAEQIETIKRGHLLLAWANAMQPGVFCLSSWDLVGALPLAEEAVAQQTKEGDYRWVNRGGVDLMGTDPTATSSACGMPRARALYGSLTEQRKDANSFVSRLKQLLAVRKQHRIAEAELLAAPEAKSPAVCLLLMKLPEPNRFALTALNFGRTAVTEEIAWRGLIPGTRRQLKPVKVLDAFSGEELPGQQETGLSLNLEGLSGRMLVLHGEPRADNPEK